MVTHPVRIASNFDKYFLNLPIELQGKLPKAHEDFGLVINYNEHVINSFSPIRENEIIIAISKLKNNSSLSPIPTKFLKLCPELLAKILCPLFNQCLDQSHFPNPLKLATIRPEYKRGEKTKMEF